MIDKNISCATSIALNVSFVEAVKHDQKSFGIGTPDYISDYQYRPRFHEVAAS